MSAAARAQHPGRFYFMTYQISGRDKSGEFTAGLVTSLERVIKTAPKIAYMRGWNIVRVRLYCEAKGWALRDAGEVNVE
jgi:hypothetical protein